MLKSAWDCPTFGRVVPLLCPEERYNVRRDAVQAEAAERRAAYLARAAWHDAGRAGDSEGEVTPFPIAWGTTLGHNTPPLVRCDPRRHAQAIEIAQCERGDLNPHGVATTGS